MTFFPLQHRTVETNGVRLHLAEMGEGPAVILCHGWPETWYSWRHQMPALAAAGFRAVAPDLRGFGRSDRPGPIEAYGILDIIGDLVGLLDALAIGEAVVVGHDWGAPVAWNCALMRPDRFRAVAGLSIPYRPRGKMSAIDLFKTQGMESFYMMYFQEPGVAERELEADIARSLRLIYCSWSGSRPEGKNWNPLVPPGKGMLENAFDAPMPLSWLSVADFAEYVGDFTASGFRGGLNWYRNLHRNWQLTAPFAHAPIRQPSLFIMGSRDGVARMLGMDVTREGLRPMLPGIAKSALIEGAGHFVQQEAPEAVNALLLEFLRGL